MKSRIRIVLSLPVIAIFLCACTTSRAAIIFSDNFSYPNGALTSVSGGIWANHSGTANQVDVVSGKTHLTEAESEDVNATISGAPYSSGTLYAGIDFNFSSLPQGAGQYFFHFKDTGTSLFRGRVFAVPGVAAGTFRIGITNGSNSGVVAIPTDLALNTDHRLVLAYDTAAVVSTLYLDSPTETGGVVATDVVTAAPISTICLRQSTTTGPTTMGILDVDNLIVATTYTEAATVPEPATISALLALGLTALHRKRH
jgi:hypothetical protein